MNEFSEQAVKVFKALADPVRYRIIQLLLAKGGDLACADIAEFFDISAPAMSHHYRILEAASLITTRKTGQYVFVSVDKVFLARFATGFEKVPENRIQ